MKNTLCYNVVIINWRSDNNKFFSIAYVLRSSGISRKSEALIVRYSQKNECISFVVFYYFDNLSIAVTLEPLFRFRRAFQQNVPLLIRTSLK